MLAALSRATFLITSFHLTCVTPTTSSRSGRDRKGWAASFAHIEEGFLPRRNYIRERHPAHVTTWHARVWSEHRREKAANPARISRVENWAALLEAG